MSLSFTLSQMEKYAISNGRCWDFVFAWREWQGIDGRFTADDMLSVLAEMKVSFSPDTDPHSWSCWYGQLAACANRKLGVDYDVFDANDLEICLEVENAMVGLKLELQKLRDGEGSMKSVRNMRKVFISFLSQVQY